MLYVSGNAIYKVESTGNIALIKDNVGNTKPSFKFSSNVVIWGVWQDNAGNIYVAVFSDQTVRKIDSNGNISDIYKSKGNRTPLHGVFDNDNHLWILETSDQNDVRVTLVETTPKATNRTGTNFLIYVIISCFLVSIAICYFRFRSINFRLIRLKN